MKPVRVCAAVAVAALSIGAPTTLASGGGVGAPDGGEEPPPSGEPGGGGGMGPPTGLDTGQYRFPLDVPHTYGDGFGAGRSHEGQDLFADCGSPILAARDGRIQRVDYQRRAGNYVVVDGKAPASTRCTRTCCAVRRCDAANACDGAADRPRRQLGQRLRLPSALRDLDRSGLV